LRRAGSSAGRSPPKHGSGVVKGLFAARQGRMRERVDEPGHRPAGRGVLGLAATFAGALVTFRLRRRLPYKRMLVVTGVLRRACT
jgi:hypothetical protein